MSDKTSHFADLSGVTLHYLRSGQGEPVVLLHGIPQTSHEWRYVMPRLAERYTVIAPDLRGLGDSSRPSGMYDKKTLGADIAELVVDHLGFKKFHLVGHDWGGPIAFSVAAHYPDAVRTLTILDVVIPGDGGDFSQGGRRWHHAFFRTLDLPEQLCFGREEMVINWLFENYGHRSNCIAEEDKAEFEAAQRAGEMLQINVLGLATIAQDVTAELARATIASVSVLGALHATPAVKAALADRMR